MPNMLIGRNGIVKKPFKIENKSETRLNNDSNNHDQLLINSCNKQLPPFFRVFDLTVTQVIRKK